MSRTFLRIQSLSPHKSPGQRSPSVGTGFPEASKTNSDKQMRQRKLAGSQRGAGRQAWGGEGPEKTEGFHHRGLLGQLWPEHLPLPQQPSPLGRMRCRSGSPACPGGTRLGPGTGRAGRRAVRLANSVQEGSLASCYLLTWRQGPGRWRWWGGWLRAARGARQQTRPSLSVAHASWAAKSPSISPCQGELGQWHVGW